MSTITISEKDLTLSNEIDTTANIVYIPGLATTGPLNTPTLCTSLTEFTNTFGISPYQFKSGQTAGGTTVAAKDYDKSFIYACELLRAGLQVLYERVLDETSYITEEEETVSDDGLLQAIYNTFLGTSETDLSIFNKLQDKWTYKLKYITSGGYSVLGYSQTPQSGTVIYPIVEIMCMIAAVRGDAIATIDMGSESKIQDIYTEVNKNIPSHIGNGYTLNANLNGSTIDNLYLKLKINPSREEEVTLKYATIVGPWGTYNTTASNLIQASILDQTMSGSFAYFKCLANAINILNSPNYYAIAGVSRGLVPDLVNLKTAVTGATAEYVQSKEAGKISINPIVEVQGYGLCLWGNRTLYPNPASTTSIGSGELIASSFLNLRVLAADVKKLIYATCQKYTFETNSTELWLKFKSDIEPLLEKMMADGSLESYDLIRQSTNEKATLKVYVKLVTIYAVEDFDITVALTDSTVEQAQ